MSTLDLIERDSREVDGDALPSLDPFRRGAVHLESAHPHGPVPRPEGQLLVWRDRSAPQRAGHDGAETLDGERPVDRQARGDVGLTSASRGTAPHQRLPHGVDTLAGAGGYT